MDTIAVKDIKLVTRIGTTERERATAQTLYLDLILTHRRTDFADDIATTVDYFPLVNEVLQLAETERQLIETLGRDVLALCMANPRVQAATVTVRKPEALKNGVPSVTVTATR